MEFLEREGQLDTRRVGSEAPVRTDPEGQVPVRVTIEDQLTRIVELLGVAIGRAERLHEWQEHEGGQLVGELRDEFRSPLPAKPSISSLMSSRIDQ